MEGKNAKLLDSSLLVFLYISLQFFYYEHLLLLAIYPTGQEFLSVSFPRNVPDTE